MSSLTKQGWLEEDDGCKDEKFNLQTYAVSTEHPLGGSMNPLTLDDDSVKEVKEVSPMLLFLQSQKPEAKNLAFQQDLLRRIALEGENSFSNKVLAADKSSRLKDLSIQVHRKGYIKVWTNELVANNLLFVYGLLKKQDAIKKQHAVKEHHVVASLRAFMTPIEDHVALETNRIHTKKSCGKKIVGQQSGKYIQDDLTWHNRFQNKQPCPSCGHYNVLVVDPGEAMRGTRQQFLSSKTPNVSLICLQKTRRGKTRRYALL